MTLEEKKIEKVAKTKEIIEKIKTNPLLKILFLNIILSTLALANSNLIEFAKEDYKFKTVDYLKSTDTKNYLMENERAATVKGSSLSSDNNRIETKIKSIKASMEIEENGLGIGIQASEISKKNLAGEKKSKEVFMKLNFYKYENEDNYLYSFGGIKLKNNKILEYKNQEYGVFIGGEYGLIKELSDNSFFLPYIRMIGSYTMVEDYEGNNTKIKEKDVLGAIIGVGIDYKLKLRNFNFITGVGYNYIYSDKKYYENAFEVEENHHLTAMVGVEYIVSTNITINTSYEVFKNGKDTGNRVSVGFSILY